MFPNRIKVSYAWRDLQLLLKGRTTIALFLSFCWYQSNFYEIWVFQLRDHCRLLSNEGHLFAREAAHVICSALVAVGLGGSTWNPSQRCLKLSSFSEAMEESSHIFFYTYVLHSTFPSSFCWWQCQDLNPERGSSAVVVTLPRVKRCCLVKVASSNTWCWYSRVKNLQRDLEEAAHKSPVHFQHTKSSYFCTGNGEVRRRNKDLKHLTSQFCWRRKEVFLCSHSFVSAHLLRLLKAVCLSATHSAGKASWFDLMV